MKKYILVILAGFLLNACDTVKKTTNPLKDKITGTWELRSAAGGITGRVRTYEPGNGTIWIFNADGTYSRDIDWGNGVSMHKGTYILFTGKFRGKENVEMMQLDGSEIYSLALNSDSTSLTLTHDAADGESYTYQKTTSK